jgi:hypothetical protein
MILHFKFYRPIFGLYLFLLKACWIRTQKKNISGWNAI